MQEKIHQETHFYVNIINNINIQKPKRFLLQSPADIPIGKEIHLAFSINSSNGAIVEVFEDVVTSQNGNPIEPINNNRKNKNNATLQIFENPIVTTDGINILVRRTINPEIPEKIIISHDKELILKPDTKYQLKITPFSNNSVIESIIDWYEV